MPSPYTRRNYIYIYFWLDSANSVFIKRNLSMPSEYMKLILLGNLVLLQMCLERLKNKGGHRQILIISRVTPSPLPNIRCAFKDHGRYYIITDIISGVALVDLPNDKQSCMRTNVR